MTKKMNESMLETIVGVPMKVVALGRLATATVGAFGAGVYEGCTGQKIFGAENPTVVLAAAAGYLTPLITAFTPDREVGLIERDEMVLTAIAFPIGAVIGVVCYGAGYAVGNLFK